MILEVLSNVHSFMILLMRDQLVANERCFYTRWQAESPRKGSSYNKTSKLSQLRAERTAARGSSTPRFPFGQARAPGPAQAELQAGAAALNEASDAADRALRSSLCKQPERAAGPGSAERRGAGIPRVLMCP